MPRVEAASKEPALPAKNRAERERCHAALCAGLDSPFVHDLPFGDDPDATWAAIVAADPSRDKRHVAWLSRLVQAGNLAAHSFHEARALLTWLEVRRRDARAGVVTDGCRTLEGLAAHLREHQDVPLAMETIIHARTDRVAVLEPLTAFAMTHWSRWTPWDTHPDICPAPKFTPLGARGLTPLIYLFDDGEKYLVTGLGPLFDESAFPIQWSDLTTFERKHMLGNDHLCQIALSKSPNAAYAIPRKSVTEAVAMKIVEVTRGGLGLIPSGQRTAAACRAAVTINGWQLQNVPKRLMTQDLCEAAVAQNPAAARYVPKPFLTGAIAEAATKARPGLRAAASGRFATAKVIEAALRSREIQLWQVPPAKRSDRVCEVAVMISPDAIHEVPQDMCSDRIYEIAARTHRWALRRIPPNRRTAKICMLAVKVTGRSLICVPPELLSREMCEAAVTQDGTALEHVPRDLLTERMCVRAVTEYGLALEHVPKEMRTRRVSAAAVKQNSTALDLVPRSLRWALSGGG